MTHVIGVIFADSHYADVNELTKVRPLGALPIDGRYRVIDFVLSNMVNSGMINVAVVTQNNYHSLMGHLGSGKHWNLARKRYGLTLFPPFSNLSSSGSDSRIDILYGVLGFLKRSTQDYVLLAESNIIINKTFNDLFKYHVAENADITVVYKNVDDGASKDAIESYILTDDQENILAIEKGENVSHATKRYFGYVLIKKQVLIELIEHSKVRGKKGYLANIVARNIGNLKIKAYNFDGYGRKIATISDYYNASMEILDKTVRDELFNSEHPIYTKDKDTTPTRYFTNANVKNCFVADGCSIDGTIENSLIFRNVKVKKGSVIKNSIILQQGEIGENVHLENVILDKKVIVRDNKTLVGTDSFPIIVEKGRII
ncbi:MAG: glucose-1-phosphate adenylyltransferase subunit GlgD [Erysipelotrichaceae bacterium]|nr:glucose-1-phosphate adenylyltransferase subunit GlgD [Erysipelotrichaceae bacterium]